MLHFLCTQWSLCYCIEIVQSTSMLTAGFLIVSVLECGSKLLSSFCGCPPANTQQHHWSELYCQHQYYHQCCSQHWPSALSPAFNIVNTVQTAFEFTFATFTRRWLNRVHCLVLETPGNLRRESIRLLNVYWQTTQIKVKHTVIISVPIDPNYREYCFECDDNMPIITEHRVSLTWMHPFARHHPVIIARIPNKRPLWQLITRSDLRILTDKIE